MRNPSFHLALDPYSEPTIWATEIDEFVNMPMPVIQRCDLADITLWPWLVARIVHLEEEPQP